MLGKYLFTVLPLLALAAASPVKRQNGTACPAFAAQDYADFQISDGTAGQAQAAANAVFVDPFNGYDLSTVDATSLKNIQTMREAAEDAETDQFNSAIDAASGDTADALSAGKIANKVLKLTGEVQALTIQQAQGKDTADKIAEEQEKLDTNIATDEASSGSAMTGVTGGSANAAAIAAANSTTSATTKSSSAKGSSAKSA
ncbi:hypothetical protein L202_03206 [Cryptococcus amylolentus CBS 6039]|uniref:Small secreted protein n=1 Tax=Cryptococcus amylolentus CBS 6039 TaxID=1295533 RepID=A0A1E3HXP9_9TREE|nr:hypothetical protein L202_03206 [Cryptococcus amylolentus CBS 6039]ODN81113.1 hypothetical protein L202_03206 [Cryptococcus amylolentus CBS 6039]